MAIYKQLEITNKGKDLIAKMILESKQMSFTKVKLSSKFYDTLPEELEQVEQEQDITDIEEIDTQTIRITTILTNAPKTYEVGAIGIYAESEEEEILFGVVLYDTNAQQNTPDRVVENTTSFSSEWKIIEDIIVTSSSIVNLTPPSQFVTDEEMKSYVGIKGEVISKDYLPLASAEEVNNKYRTKDTNTIYKCIYDNNSYTWLEVDSNILLEIREEEREVDTMQEGIIYGMLEEA